MFWVWVLVFWVDALLNYILIKLRMTFYLVYKLFNPSEIMQAATAFNKYEKKTHIAPGAGVSNIFS